MPALTDRAIMGSKALASRKKSRCWLEGGAPHIRDSPEWKDRKLSRPEVQQLCSLLGPRARPSAVKKRAERILDNAEAARVSNLKRLSTGKVKRALRTETDLVRGLLEWFLIDQPEHLDRVVMVANAWAGRESAAVPSDTVLIPLLQEYYGALIGTEKYIAAAQRKHRAEIQKFPAEMRKSFRASGAKTDNARRGLIVETGSWVKQYGHPLSSYNKSVFYRVATLLLQKFQDGKPNVSGMRGLVAHAQKSLAIFD